MTQATTRRGVVPLALGAAAGCGLVLPAYAAGEGGGGEGVSATEDLMREHGVLRRTLIVYAELVPRLRARPETVDAGALAEAAVLFRTFGELGFCGNLAAPRSQAWEPPTLTPMTLLEALEASPGTRAP